MSFTSLRRPHSIRRRVVAVSALAALVIVALPRPARAQDTAAAAAVKANFLSDLEGLRAKFVGLAQTFPQDKYTWRPMDGVRSVSEVLMLAATEGYGFIPAGFGGKPGLPREEMGKLAAVTDKAQVLDHLNKAFAHARMEVEAADPASLVAKRRVMGQDHTILEGASLISSDLHEHLGQMIAYARMNHIVPPWSK